MKTVTLATAGHIDHGKTALVRALTGINTDRLPEEKRRGITIDIGFAHVDLTPALRLAIIDVPGHEAFVRNMATGASGVDLGLLVIAADKGVMPQTREHLHILHLLGVQLAAVVLSKSDRAEQDWLDLVRHDVRHLLQNSPSANAPIVAASAVTGAGLEELRQLLTQRAARVERADLPDFFRMPIDRVFTMTGTGTVVTGTVWSGQLQRDAAVHLIPAGLIGRVRALQRQGAPVDSVGSGERAAVALAGLSVRAIQRGETLVTNPDWQAAQQLTVHLSLLEHAAALRDRQRVHLHLGTAAVTARVRLFQSPLAPGESAAAVLQLEHALATRAGDHFILRSYSPVSTIAGGFVLEWQPQRYRRRNTRLALLQALQHQDAERRTDATLLLAGSRGIALEQLPLHVIPPIRLPASATLLHQLVFHSVVVDRIAARLLTQLRALHARFPLRAGVSREAVRAVIPGTIPTTLREHVLNSLIEQHRIRLAGSLLRLPDWKPQHSARHAQLRQSLINRLQQAGTVAPPVAQLTNELGADVPELLDTLAGEGLVTRINPDWYLWTDAIRAAQAALTRSLLTGPQPTGELKRILGLSRKHLIPFLEFCDRQGLTTRVGDQRTLTSLETVSQTGDATA